MRNAANERDDDDIERITHSFVLKIWLEAPDRAARPPIWRGYITHVASGKRRYVKELSDIVAVLIPYLTAMGVRLSHATRLWWWLYRQKSRLKL